MGSSLNPREVLQQRWGDDWLVGIDSQVFWQRVEVQIEQCREQASPVVLITERDPLKFLSTFWAAWAADCPIYLGSPDWGEREWQQVWAQGKPDTIWGDLPPNCLPPQTAPLLALERGRVGIPTGGSGGQIKFAVHSWETLVAAVEGFQQHFQVGQVHAYCVLPLYHVSGLMQALRAFISRGRLAIQPFKALSTGNRLTLPAQGSFISLVPTQLQRLLTQGAATWLSQFQAVLLGGAPAWSALLEQARLQAVPVALTYGMTETAAQVATLLPAEFLSGRNCAGRVLPHARIEIWDEAGAVLPPGEVGQICVYVRSLAHRYIQTHFGSQSVPTGVEGWRGFLPGDLGYLDEQGYLSVVGRNSTKIITGGEKVFPEEVERVIRETGLVSDVCVVGLTDPDWGQVVTAVYVPGEAGPEVGKLRQQIMPQLSKFKQPKHWIAVESLLLNAQGKVNRQAVLQLAKQRLKSVS
ncbi:2-succinylbenzoate--CoA ligase [Pseudanabaena sp. FACHB-2040]|uniref:2-succinylbenzoate--CoA ligase n=1 Tax=Pseudanabaena sp. FACHB-2040 TaxID=2692859 RepID=UPI0016829F0A|nr:2-succinylbenzoate--CoA ligase [Pseudanabaena sp. FACHB-2040]MBD2257233.1 2-succinylbenzoate--CoA ligase [Pseudanabaena sp. FACHB-2040]